MGEWRRLLSSFGCAWRGLRFAVRRERNLRIHLAAIGYVGLAAWLGKATALQWALLALCFGLVPAAELLNTAIERLCDRFCTGYDDGVRHIKDMAAAAVLLCALSCVAVGVCLFLGEGLARRAWVTLSAHPWGAAAVCLSIPIVVRWVIGRRT